MENNPPPETILEVAYDKTPRKKDDKQEAILTVLRLGWNYIVNTIKFEKRLKACAPGLHKKWYPPKEKKSYDGGGGKGILSGVGCCVHSASKVRNHSFQAVPSSPVTPARAGTGAQQTAADAAAATPFAKKSPSPLSKTDDEGGRPGSATKRLGDRSKKGSSANGSSLIGTKLGGMTGAESTSPTQRGLPKTVRSFPPREVMQAVENMAGRLLSKIHACGIEIRIEVLRVQESLNQMVAISTALSKRVDKIRGSQEKFLREFQT